MYSEFKTLKVKSIEDNGPILTNDFINNSVSKTADKVVELMPTGPTQENIEAFCLLLANELMERYNVE